MQVEPTIGPPAPTEPTEDIVPAWGQWPGWGDQGDGTYRNPVLPADFSDLDAICVGNVYYAIASTLHGSPGMVVLQSQDLLDWQIIGHVVPDLTVLGPGYGWSQMARHGRGVWAGSIRHHRGRFYVLFGTPDEGLFVSSAVDARGPWSPLGSLISGAGWDDCSALWDDDGRAYFIATRFADNYKTYLFGMAADASALDMGSAVLIQEGMGREASKLIKRNGWYYIIYSEHRDGIGRYVMARRSRTPMGNYGDERQLAPVHYEAFEPNQGGLVEAGGKWFFLTHHGRQAWEGRAMSLLPVTWQDDWPLIGDPDPRRPMVWRWTKPIAGPRPDGMILSDDFNGPQLGSQWEWNHQPRADRWSLTERPGWLRLQAWMPLVPGDLRKTGNMLGQRSFRTVANSVTAKLDVSGMVDGQHAGLAHVSNDFASLGIIQSGVGRAIEYRTAGGADTVAPLDRAVVWLRSTWGLDGVARFSYSLDGQNFRAIEASYQMTHGDYRGDRICLYTCNEMADRGHVDVDRVDYAIDRS